MKQTVYRPCTICPTGFFKCNQNEHTKTCSKRCSKIYQKGIKYFYKLSPGWHKANDLKAYKKSQPIRIGNHLKFKA